MNENVQSSPAQNLPVHQSIPTLAWIIPLAFSVVLDPCYAPGYRNFDVFLFCCALESSCLGRLSAIKVELELTYIPGICIISRVNLEILAIPEITRYPWLMLCPMSTVNKS